MKQMLKVMTMFFFLGVPVIFFLTCQGFALGTADYGDNPDSYLTLEKNIRETAEVIYQELLDAGTEAIIDDREERPGVKFKDSDLVGIPLRITIGSKSLKQNSVEIRIRKTGQIIQVPKNEYRQMIQELVDEMLKV